MSLERSFLTVFWLHNTITDPVYMNIEPKDDWGRRLTACSVLLGNGPVCFIPDAVALPLVTFRSTKLLKNEERHGNNQPDSL